MLERFFFLNTSLFHRERRNASPYIAVMLLLILLIAMSFSMRARTCIGATENIEASFFIQDVMRFSVTDATRMERLQMPLRNFFRRALTSLLVWDETRLTHWLMSKVHRRADTYAKVYEHHLGVNRAGRHWEDLMRRSESGYYQVWDSVRNDSIVKYTYGVEPDHDLSRPGFQDMKQCGICQQQLRDLKYP